MRAEGDLSDTILLEPAAVQPLAAAVATKAPHRVMVGPEGGWTGEEIAAALAAGAHTAHLGVRVLRAETAALAALATLDAVGCLRAG